MDTAVFEWINSWRTPLGDEFMKAITILGDWRLLLPAVGLLCLLLLSFGKKKEALGFLLAYAGGLLVLLIKYSVQRLRPFPDLALVDEIGFSFPSAHAFLSMTIYGFLMVCLWRTKLQNWIKWLGFLFLGMLILVVSFSRIYLGVHWFSDVIAGILLGIVWIVGIVRIVGK